MLKFWLLVIIKVYFYYKRYISTKFWLKSSHSLLLPKSLLHDVESESNMSKKKGHMYILQKI